MGLCEYRHALGVPGRGVHAWRVPLTDTAGFDYFATLAGAWLLSASTGVNLSRTTAFLLVLGELLHWLFCVRAAP
jgi:hypothetical protein